MIIRQGRLQCETSKVRMCSSWIMLDHQPKAAALHNTIAFLLQMPSIGRGTAPRAGLD